MRDNLFNLLPPMLTGEELIKAMTVLPGYNASMINMPPAVRLIALNDLYKLYIPSAMSLEIYSKLYLALLRSLQKKGTMDAVRQKYENLKAIRQQVYTGIIGGSDSFTIIGASGIGKSTAISRALDLITANGIMEQNNPYVRIIPCVVVQCPFDSSVKGLLLEILRKVDEQLGSKYYQNALRVRCTTDMLIGSVSQVALNHIGLLVVDEIQNVVGSKYGKSLIGMLTQLINNSGISICMVGTPESTAFFEQAMQLARRSLGDLHSNFKILKLHNIPPCIVLLPSYAESAFCQCWSLWGRKIKCRRQIESASGMMILMRYSLIFVLVNQGTASWEIVMFLFLIYVEPHSV